MTRLTYLENGAYHVDSANVSFDGSACAGEAVERLAVFESIYENLTAEQDSISAELEALRREGKEHTVKFKQLFAKKLQNNGMLVIFDTYIK